MAHLPVEHIGDLKGTLIDAEAAGIPVHALDGVVLY